MATGSITCRREHATVCEWFCEQVNGGLSSNPDGSVTCEFAIPTKGGASRVEGSFKVPSDSLDIGRSACNQLGGKFEETNSGAKCTFYLPQEARWSSHHVSNYTMIIRFDPEVFYLVACDVNEFSVRVVDGGAITEEYSFAISPPDHTGTIFVRDAEGRFASFCFQLSKDSTTLNYYFKGKLIYELKAPSRMVGRIYMERSSEAATPQPEIPYLGLLARALTTEPSLQDLARRLRKPATSTAQAPNGLFDDFCESACSICEASKDSLWCLACFGCKVIKAPSPDGPIPV